MSSKTAKEWGAETRGEVYFYYPEDLISADDEGHPLYDPRVEKPLDEQMVESIMLYGVKENLIIRKNGARKDGTPVIEIMDGRQRKRNAVEANRRLVAAGLERRKVPCSPERCDDKVASTIMNMLNTHRSGDEPMTRARKMQRHMGFGHDVKQTAMTFHCSEATVRSMLTLLDCSSSVQKAVEDKSITVGAAKKLAVMPREEQDEELRKIVSAEAPPTPKARDQQIEKATAGRKKLRATGARARSIAEWEGIKKRLKTLADPMVDLREVIRFALRDDKAFKGNEPLRAIFFPKDAG